MSVLPGCHLMISAAVVGVTFGTFARCLDTTYRAQVISVMERTIATRGVKILVIDNRIDILGIIWVFLWKLTSPRTDTI